MPTPSRTENARQRLQLMQQSGISQRIRAMHHDERQAAAQAQKARQECENTRRYADLGVLKTMMLLITGVEQIKASATRNGKHANYEQNKEFVRTLIETKPDGKNRKWYAALETAGQYLYAGIPGAIGEGGGRTDAAKAVAAIMSEQSSAVDKIKTLIQ